MNVSQNDCCILNEGSGAWAFEPLDRQLSAALRIPVSKVPRRFNYVLNLEPAPQGEGDFPFLSFVPSRSIRIASDKRLIASVFEQHDVPRPHTALLESFVDVMQYVANNSDREWCLKFPTACGAIGHRMLTPGMPEPANWPSPWVVQEYVRLERPEVFRLYCAGGEAFGWMARRFPAGATASPWVAHARGAIYERAGDAPAAVVAAGRAAVQVTGLWDAFGCADLLCRPSGEWVVLEVGTDGVFNHVDRELGDPELEKEIGERIARAFWKWVEVETTSSRL
jgi:hypothetical protein